MKTIICAINSKYIHSALSPWYLKAACGNRSGEVLVREYTINDNPEDILKGIYREKADHIAFCCYIWNIGLVLRLCRSMKLVSPDTTIILGGPEVSFDASRLLQEYPEVDYIITGEGELPFSRLLEQLEKGWPAGSGLKYPTAKCGQMPTVIEGLPDKPSPLNHSPLPDDFEDSDNFAGLVYRNQQGEIKENPPQLIGNLDTIPSPYTLEMMGSIGNRIVYYEASRGCPFSCSYCLSSCSEGVRVFSMPRVKEEIGRLISFGVRQIKFVDRTFNCMKSRAKEIFRHIIEESSEGVNFHFEMAADLFDEEMMEILSKANPGLIQFEIGIQTVNRATLSAIHRETDLMKAFRNINRLRAMNNINLHLDLIAGLPYEDMESFRESFDRVYTLEADQLQLGFLKLLKGTAIRRESDNHGYRFSPYPPYEVFSNQYISYDEILELKGIEDLLERYHNSGKFKRTLSYCIHDTSQSPYGFFKDFAGYAAALGWSFSHASVKTLYGLLMDYMKSLGISDSKCLILNEWMKFDYLSWDNTNSLPSCIQRNFSKDFHDDCFRLLRDEELIRRVLPGYLGMPAKMIMKKVHFELFDIDVEKFAESSDFAGYYEKSVVVFDYAVKNPVTGLYHSYKINFGRNHNQ